MSYSRYDQGAKADDLLKMWKVINYAKITTV